MSERDDLAQLIRDTIRARFFRDDAPQDAAYICEDDPADDVTVDGQVDLRAVADAIIEAGWRPPRKHYLRRHSTECGLCGLTWPCEGAP